MTKTITTKEAQGQLDALIDLAAKGEDVLIENDHHSRVKLVPVPAVPSAERVFGQHRGSVSMSDDFDAPIPESFWLSGTP